jgi:hypothetical protein
MEHQHQVEAVGKLRFALTSRYLDPNMIADAADRAASQLAGTFPADFNYTYDGTKVSNPVKAAPTALAKVSENLAHLQNMVKVGEISQEMLREMLSACFPTPPSSPSS